MRSRTLIDEKQSEETIRNIPNDAFTVLDFMETFKSTYPNDWSKLVGRFGLYRSGRRYTVSTYLSNRLDVYSQKHESILVPFKRHKKSKFKDYRRPTEEEKRRFGSPWIAVFKKKNRAHT